MTDEEFLNRFERDDLAEFTHRDHLRVAFAYARRDGVAAAVAGARRIRQFAEAHGDRTKYHETITVAWARLVAEDAAVHESLEALLEARPDLLDRDRLARHYSPALLESVRARTAFVDPDREPLPALTAA